MLAFATIAFACPAAAEAVFPKGLQIGLTPVGDLTPSPQLNGFTDPDRKVAVVIAQFPAAAYPELEKSMFDKPPAGVADVHRETFPFANGVGYLMSGHGSDNGRPFTRWVMLARAAIGDSSFSAVVTVTVPDVARSAYPDDTIRKMLKSVTFRKPPIAEQLALMPFKLNELAGFHVVQVLPAGAVVLTDGKSGEIKNQPYVVVSIARGDADEAQDRARFARDLLSSLPLKDLTVKSAEDMRIDGRPGFELRAEASQQSGTPVSLVQWVRFNGRSFIRIVAVSDRDHWEAMFNRFRSIRDGVELRR
jgi:hypothetical protein